MKRHATLKDGHVAVMIKLLLLLLLLLLFLKPTSRKPQARKLKLNNVNGCNDVSCGVHCALEGDRIPPLESYGQALEQECRFPVVLCHS